MGELISQLERIARSDLELIFEGNEILISEQDKKVHIATTGRGTERTKIDFTYLRESQINSVLACHVNMVKKQGLNHVVFLESHDGSTKYGYVIHQNPADLECHSVATVPTQDYVNRVKELKK